MGSCVKGFSTREQLEEVEDFLKKRKGGGAQVSFGCERFERLGNVLIW